MWVTWHVLDQPKVCKKSQDDGTNCLQHIYLQCAGVPTRPNCRVGPHKLRARLSGPKTGWAACLQSVVIVYAVQS